MEKQPPLYQIVDWNKHFENNKSRIIEHCAFVCVPNNPEEFGLVNVLSEPDGSRIYGCWILLLQICSRQRRPREGWLTHNGKKDGPRMSGVEMARSFRASTIAVWRMLQVLTRRDVEWLKLVDGEPEYSHIREEELLQSGTNPALPGTNPALPGTNPALPGIEVPDEQPPENQGVVGAGTNPALPGTNPALPGTNPALGRHRTEQKEQTEVPENRTVPTTTVLLSQNCEEIDDGIGEDEAKAWLTDLFPNPQGWSYEEHRLLLELLPIPRDVYKVINWAHRLSRDHPLHELTKLRQKRISLLGDFRGEYDKARKMREQLGYNGEFRGKK